MKRTKSSKRWLNEHFSDIYVKQAKKEGYRSRSAYKLLELQERDQLFKPGMVVVDLGASPGGWSQLMSKWVTAKGRVIAVDLLLMEPIPGVQFIQGDFSENAVIEQIRGQIADTPVDWVVSDMAPNLSGIGVADQARMMDLAEMAVDFARQVLAPDGSFLIKLFQGVGSDQFILDLRKIFTKVIIRKPKASRGRSPEVYVLARGFKG